MTLVSFAFSILMGLTSSPLAEDGTRLLPPSPFLDCSVAPIPAILITGAGFTLVNISATAVSFLPDPVSGRADDFVGRDVSDSELPQPPSFPGSVAEDFFFLLPPRVFFFFVGPSDAMLAWAMPSFRFPPLDLELGAD
ncbi:hypothetical protein I7I53_03485 [Histoplasma capsulatum var. duboisii H88]|uniref:Secreted protein n=1 Tax=Ajellomyces capsulatus (strain H88) TaxID=544711 RepID=A0A8A1LQB6_AJEC8|nr:hypothetical protein I7I53_03485 [Histoplasma capsulatum var. duboisii H88]